MKLKRKLDSPESKEYWEFADKMLQLVDNYPNWKKGGDSTRSNEDSDRSNKSNSRPENGQSYNLK